MVEHDRDRLQHVLGELQTAVGADIGAALFLDDGDGALTLVASTAHGAAKPGWSNRLLRTSGPSNVLVVPVPDAAGGVVVLERSGKSDFTRDDRSVAHVYARQLANRISVGSVFRHSVWTRQLEAIQRIAAQLTRLASVEEVGAAICRETRQVMEYDEAHVLLVGPAGLYPVAAVPGPSPAASSAGALSGTSDDDPAGRPGLAVSGDSPIGLVIGRALASGSPLLASEVVDPTPDRPGRWSLLAVPMRYERRVSGLICLLVEGAARFDDDDGRLLQILSDQAAVAIENAKLLAGRDELVRELNALLDVSTAANQPTDEQSLAAVLAGTMRRATRMDGCVIARWEEESTTLRLLGSDNVAVAPVPDVLDFPIRRAVLRDGRPYVVQLDGGTSAVATPADGGKQVSVIEATQAETRALLSAGVRTSLLMPLSVAGRAIGLVELLSYDGSRTFGNAEMQVYQTMAGSVAAGLENVRLLEQLRVAADIDQVTGVNNHRYLQDRLRQEVARAARSRSPICLLMVDLDNFKPVNDRHGHADGDRVLRNIAATIRGVVRTNDIVARYGGDEFVVVMPDTPAEQGQDVARRVVNGILLRRHDLDGGATVTVGASAGMSVYPDDGRTAAALLAAADAAMYEAKRAQQPRVSRASGEIIEALAASAG